MKFKWVLDGKNNHKKGKKKKKKKENDHVQGNDQYRLILM